MNQFELLNQEYEDTLTHHNHALCTLVFTASISSFNLTDRYTLFKSENKLQKEWHRIRSIYEKWYMVRNLRTRIQKGTIADLKAIKLDMSHLDTYLSFVVHAAQLSLLRFSTAIAMCQTWQNLIKLITTFYHALGVREKVPYENNNIPLHHRYAKYFVNALCQQRESYLSRYRNLLYEPTTAQQHITTPLTARIPNRHGTQTRRYCNNAKQK